MKTTYYIYKIINSSPRMRHIENKNLNNKRRKQTQQITTNHLNIHIYLF